MKLWIKGIDSGEDSWYNRGVMRRDNEKGVTLVGIEPNTKKPGEILVMVDDEGKKRRERIICRARGNDLFEGNYIYVQTNKDEYFFYEYE